MSLMHLFPTPLYRAIDTELAGRNADLERRILALREQDEKSASDPELQKVYRWEEYTSYFTHRRLHTSEHFGGLESRFRHHVGQVLSTAGVDLTTEALTLTESFANVMDQPYHHHGRHVHPGAAFSGVYYVRCDPGCGPITFEDPALDHWMVRLAYRERTLENVSEISIAPNAGELLIFPGHLPHRVEQSGTQAVRIAISFNFHLRQ